MRWIFVGLLAAIVAAVAFFPLRIAVGRMAPGLQADSIAGSIWDGRVRNARWQGVPLGDLDVGLAFRPLLRGDARLNVKRLNPELAGQIGSDRTTRRIDGLTGDLRLALLPAPIPEIGLRFADVSLAFAMATGCQAAGGVVTAQLKGLPLIGESPPLSGTPRCDGAAAFLPLLAASGQMGLDLWLWQDGRYRGGLRVMTASPFALVALVGAGFAPVDGGATLLVEGRLGEKPSLAKG